MRPKLRPEDMEGSEIRTIATEIRPITPETAMEATAGPYIGWSEEEQVYLAKHFDFPGVVGKGSTEGEAYQNMMKELTKASQ